MNTLRERSRSFLASEEGPTTTEYAAMLALIIIIAVGAITAIGAKVSAVYTNIEGGIPDGAG
jgi:Flp pilus assembly pilin Flp